MPYRRGYRKNYRRKRRYYRRRRPPQRISYWKTAQQLWKDVGYLKSLVNTEFKAKTLINSSQTFSTTGSLTLLNGLSQGDDFDNRSGRQVRFKSLQFRGSVEQHASATQTFLRLIWVIDKQPNASTPVIGDILTSTSIAATRNLDNRKRFVILKDILVQMNSNGKSTSVMKFYHNIDMKT